MEKPVRQLKLLVGLPGVGKSTYIKEHISDFEGYVILSIDDEVKKFCQKKEKETGKPTSIDSAYQNDINSILDGLKEDFIQALNDGKNILIDATGKYKLRSYVTKIAKSMNSYDYQTTAIVIASPSEQKHVRQLLKRSLQEKRFSAVNCANISGIEPIQDGEFDHVEYIGTPSATPVFHEYSKKISLEEAIKDAKNCGTGQWTR